MTFALSEKKLKNISTMSGDFQATKNFSPKSHKVNWPVVQAILQARIQFRYLQQEQILALQKKGSYSGHVTLGNLAREELLWWMENLKLCNGRKTQQREPHMIIQTDASTKGWGHNAREF